MVVVSLSLKAVLTLVEMLSGGIPFDNGGIDLFTRITSMIPLKVPSCVEYEDDIKDLRSI